MRQNPAGVRSRPEDFHSIENSEILSYKTDLSAYADIPMNERRLDSKRLSFLYQEAYAFCPQ